MIDRAHAIASRPDVIFCSFGDMLRVPGSRGDLLQLKSQGSDVRIVYSPLDAVNLAAANPDRQVVFFAIGFETTAPPNAMAVWLAREPAADELQRAGVARAGAAGDDGHPAGAGQPRAGVPRPGPRLHRHGLHRIRADRPPLPGADRHHRLRADRPARRRAAHACSSSKRAGRRSRTSTAGRSGTRATRRRSKLIDDVFEVCDRKWRGVGLIPKSGFKLRYEYRDHDAERLFEVDDIETQESSVCISGQILKGLKKPHDCPAFGKECTPQTPLGATMVSAEGACAAYYAYGRHLEGKARRAGGVSPLIRASEHQGANAPPLACCQMGDRSMAAVAAGDLHAKILRKCRESMATKEQFFTENADRIAECCAAMARAFDAGGRLFVMGNGGSSCDAAHVSVEFMHPIIEKRPALPAMALTTDTAMLTAVGNDQDFSLAFAQQLRMLGRPGDMALGISTSGKSANVNRALQAAREMGMLTVGFSGRDGGRMPEVLRLLLHGRRASASTASRRRTRRCCTFSGT